MSIAIAIAVPDGIALAADSQTTWFNTITAVTPKGSDKKVELAEPIQQPVGWSRMARKLFSIEIAGTQFAIATAGVASINKKTPYSLIRSLATRYEGGSDLDSISKYLVEGVRDAFKDQFGSKDLSSAPIMAMDFIIAGFDSCDVSKPLIESHLVYSGTLNVNGSQDASGHFRKNQLPVGDFGGCWIGRVEFIKHALNPESRDLPQIQGQFHMMSLADALDYTRFLVEFTCDYQRFALMVPDCARPIVTATLTPEGYTETLVE